MCAVLLTDVARYGSRSPACRPALYRVAAEDRVGQVTLVHDGQDERALNDTLPVNRLFQGCNARSLQAGIQGKGGELIPA